MYTAELAWTLSFDCRQISCFRRFFWERAGIKVELIHITYMYTANTLNTTLTDFIPPSRQKMRVIRKLNMNLLGRYYKAKGHTNFFLFTTHSVCGKKPKTFEIRVIYTVYIYSLYVLAFSFFQSRQIFCQTSSFLLKDISAISHISFPRLPPKTFHI